MGKYSSLTEHMGRRVIWHPDRKHFLLGKLIPNELLADMTVPKGRGRVHYYGHSPSVGDL